jgi:hypothetical protein
VTVLHVTLYLPENKTTPSQPSIFWKIPILTIARFLHHLAFACLHHHENKRFLHNIPSTTFSFKSYSACLISIKLIFSLYVQSTNIGIPVPSLSNTTPHELYTILEQLMTSRNLTKNELLGHQ